MTVVCGAARSRTSSGGMPSLCRRCVCQSFRCCVLFECCSYRPLALCCHRLLLYGAGLHGYRVELLCGAQPFEASGAEPQHLSTPPAPDAPAERARQAPAALHRFATAQQGACDLSRPPPPPASMQCVLTLGIVMAKCMQLVGIVDLMDCTHGIYQQTVRIAIAFVPKQI